MISLRLKTIADFININDSLVDVGCDHAKLSIYLVQNNLAKKVIASDVNGNALDNAIKNIKNLNLAEKIPTILSNGIENINIFEESINTLAISGMGTKTILTILNNEKLKNINKIIIQSNNDYYNLRKEIIKKGFFIQDEKIIFENGKYYLTILFLRGNKKYCEKDYQFGMIKAENIEYYCQLYKSEEKIYNMLSVKQLGQKIRKLIFLYKIKRIIKRIK